MSILNRLFSRKPPAGNASMSNSASSPRRESLTLKFTGITIQIPEIDFIGQYEKSKSNEWLIAWADFDQTTMRGGNRESGSGQYLLINTNTCSIACQGKMERPNHGHVSDVGIFSLEDYHFGNELSGTFNVLSSNGNILVSRRVQANIYNSGISEDGKFAAFQTANSKTEDGNKLTLIETKSNHELFSVNPKTGWANKYEFESDSPILIVCHEELGKFRYDIHGTFLDFEKFKDAKLKSNKYNIALMAVADLMKNEKTNHKDAQKGLSIILKARSSGADNDKYWKPIALKLQGQANEILGNTNAALQAYEDALLLDPKIGVKQKINSLRKK